MASVVEIGSNALRLIGADPITDLSDDSERARLISALWPNVRDAVLRAHGWKFARRRASLALEATAPIWEYANSFTLPVDPWCLRVLKTDLDDMNIPWVKEGRSIVTDATVVRILYVARIEDPGAYDSSFESAVTARLAADLAYPITSSTDIAEKMFELYSLKLVEARFFDSTEGSPTGTISDDFITARRGMRQFVPIRPYP